MNAHKMEAVLMENGQLILQNIPFKKGDAVEVIILKRSLPESEYISFSHKNQQPYSYDDPFEPATDIDHWQALQ